MRVFFILIGILLLAGCQTEIEVVDDTGSVPIVYCVLNQDDTVQQLRLARSYLSYNATNPPLSADSLLVGGKVNITIEEVGNSLVTAVNPMLPFLAPKDSGFFPGTANRIYRGSFQVKDNTLYRLIVEIKGMDYLAYSSFMSLGDFELVDPAYPLVRKIHLVDDHNPLIHWTRCPNAAVYQVGYRVHYTEFREDVAEDKTVVILFATAFYRNDPGAFYSFTVNSNQFYKRMAETLKADSGLLRKIATIDTFVIAGSESLGFYLSSYVQQDPFFTVDFRNVLNGQGIFGSCRTREAPGFMLDDQSIDSLAYGFYTAKLNFLDSNGHRKE
jgi:hypothetical protein